MAGYAELEIEQGADYALQIVWTDVVNEAYRVCHPIRLQARSLGGQALLDLSSVDQTTEQSEGSTPRIIYNTEGGVLQIIVPASVTAQLPPGELYYDMFVSYESTSFDYINNEETDSIRVAKVMTGKIKVEGRVTKSL